jgi:hypothetical protein
MILLLLGVDIEAGGGIATVSGVETGDRHGVDEEEIMLSISWWV